MRGEKLVWVWAAAIAGLVILAELVLVDDDGFLKTVLLVIALGVIGTAYFKVKGDGKTLQPIKPHRKKSGGR